MLVLLNWALTRRVRHLISLLLRIAFILTPFLLNDFLKAQVYCNLREGPLFPIKSGESKMPAIILIPSEHLPTRSPQSHPTRVPIPTLLIIIIRLPLQVFTFLPRHRQTLPIPIWVYNPMTIAMSQIRGIPMMQ